MKKLLLLFILLSCVESHAIEGSLKFGYFLKNNLYFAGDERDTKYRTVIELHEDFKYLTIGTEVESFMTDFSNSSFAPSTVIYRLSIEKQVREFNVGYEHTCWHGVNRVGGVIIQDEIFVEYKF